MAYKPIQMLTFNVHSRWYAMNEEKEVPKKLKLVQDLAEQGYNDVLVLTRESANKVLTKKERNYAM